MFYNNYDKSTLYVLSIYVYIECLHILKLGMKVEGL